jgi:hypothetical protein
MGAAEEPRDASVGRGTAGALLASGVLDGLLAGCRRTGTVGGTPRVARSSSGPSHGAQPVSPTSRCEVQSRMTTRIGVPHVGQRGTRRGEGVRGVGGSWRGWPCSISRGMAARGTAQRAWRPPQGRTVTKPSGKTGWRKRRSNAMTSRGAVRRRARPTCREVHVTVRSVRRTRRWWERATVQTEGAREGKAEEPWGVA